MASVENIPDPKVEVGGDGVEKVVIVKLGKYRNVDGGGEGSSSNNVDNRGVFQWDHLLILWMKLHHCRYQLELQ